MEPSSAWIKCKEAYDRIRISCGNRVGHYVLGMTSEEEFHKLCPRLFADLYKGREAFTMLSVAEGNAFASMDYHGEEMLGSAWRLAKDDEHFFRLVRSELPDLRPRYAPQRIVSKPNRPRDKDGNYLDLDSSSSLPDFEDQEDPTIKFHKALEALQLPAPDLEALLSEAEGTQGSISRTSTTETDAIEVPAKEPSDGKQDAYLHSADHRSVIWFGTEYSFTKTQALIVQDLWEAWKQGTPDIGEGTLLNKAESDSSKLRELFKDHPAFGTMIVQGSTKGTFRLQKPASEE